MKRGRLPLTALRSFEVAGRLESFTLAAEELHVSQAAISRQIRELEASLGLPLFERRHRAVRLTQEGARLLSVLTNAFDHIDIALTAITQRPAVDTVKISSEPNFAALWFMPNLADFRALHPDIDVIVETENRVIEFRADDADLAVRYSEKVSHWPRSQSHHLIAVKVMPVIAPSLLASLGPIKAPADLLAHTLLHEENRDLWGRWFTQAGISDLAALRGPVYADGSMVMQAVLRGHGIGLCDVAYMQQEITDGLLVPLFDMTLDYGHFYLVARDFAALPPPARHFADWMGKRFAQA